MAAAVDGGLVQLLRERGLTLTELARRTGLSLAYVSRVVRGEAGSHLPASQIIAFADALGLPVETLVRLLADRHRAGAPHKRQRKPIADTARNAL